MAGEQQRPADDASIDDDAFLLRSVHPTGMDREQGVLRVTSNAFQVIPDAQTGKEAVSAFEETKLGALGASAADLISGRPDFGVVAIRVGIVRSMDLGVTWEPNDLSFGEAHVHINGVKSRGIRRRLAASCEYRVWPEPVPQ